MNYLGKNKKRCNYIKSIDNISLNEAYFATQYPEVLLSPSALLRTITIYLLVDEKAYLSYTTV